MREAFYRPHFHRHLHNLVINGFFARDIDADDWEFLEYVKARGSANSSLPGSSAVLIEELEFWHLPYTIAPNVERRAGWIGRKPRPEETPEQYQQRKMRQEAWKARRVIREQEQAIADAELAREKREWEQANENRKITEMLTDAEWNAAAPKASYFGATIDRHHVPEWRLEARGIVKPIKTPRGTRMMTRAEVREAIEKLTEEERKRRAAAERTQIRKKMIAAQAKEDEEQDRKIAEAKKKRDKIKREKERDAQRAQAERSRQEAILREARDNLFAINLMQRQWDGTAYPDHASLKAAIVTLLTRTPGHPWYDTEMARSLGVTDMDFMRECLAQLVSEARLRKTETAR